MNSSSSQEVGNNSFIRDNWRTLVGKKDVERGFKVRVNSHERSTISAPVAVIWSRPNSNQVSVFKPMFVTIHNKLMCSGNK
jgi:hypothetical protein